LSEENQKDGGAGGVAGKEGPGPVEGGGSDMSVGEPGGKKAMDSGHIDEAGPAPQAPPPVTKDRRAIPGSAFLGTTRGKVVALILVVIIVVAAMYGTGMLRVSVTVKTTVQVPVGNTTVPENYYAEETLSFTYGHRRAPVGTSQTVTFPVEANATDGMVETTGDPGSIPRWDQGDRKEVDIEVIGANGKSVKSSATTSIHEVVKLKAIDFERGGPGEWQVIVDCYSGTNVVVTVKIWVNYSVGNVTGNGTGNYTPGKAPGLPTFGPRVDGSIADDVVPLAAPMERMSRPTNTEP